MSLGPTESKRRAELTDEDIARIDHDLTDPDEVEPEWQPPVHKIDMSKGRLTPQELHTVRQAGQSKPAMVFAILDYKEMTKERTEDIARRWTSEMHSTGLSVKPFVLKEDNILFSMNTGRHAEELRTYLLDQAEVAEVTQDSNSAPGPAFTPSYQDRKQRSKSAAEAGKGEDAAAKRRKKTKKKRTTAKEEL